MRKCFLAAALAGLFFTATGARSAAPCDEIVAKLPNVKRALCESAKLQPSAAQSVQGRTLWLAEIKPEHPSLRVLVLGGIHGDELSSSAMALQWIQLAQQAPAETPQVVHWRFIPLLNPDGLFNRPPRRVNANGVDLNRNFPTLNWQRDAKEYWEKRTGKDPRRYPGPKALSEPESRFLIEEIQRFQPQLIVSIHAPYGLLDFDGPAKDGYVPPSKLGRLYLDQIGIFPGSLGNYGGMHKGVPVVTIELANSTRTPLDAEMRQMWLDLLRWMSEHVGPNRGPGIASNSGSGSGGSATPAAMVVQVVPGRVSAAPRVP